MSIEVTVEYAHREWNAYDHVVHIRNYQQLQAKVAELEAEVERLSAAHIKACQANADSQTELAKAEQRVAEYNELLYAVQTKTPDETRHQTALRYIRNAENRQSYTAANGASS